MYKHYILGIFYTWVSVLFISCSNRHHGEFLDVITANIIEENRVSLQLTKYFCRCKDGNIGLLDFKELKSIHSREYAGMDYEEYLKELFSEEITVSWDDIPCFSLDADVSKRYDSLDFETFTTYYWKDSPIDTFVSKESITHDNINSVAYFMFKNGYLTRDSFDPDFGYQCFYYQRLIE